MNKFEYKNLTPFKWFVLENFPFIEADCDALTEWQIFCKLGKEINKIIDSQNIVGEQAENLTNAFNNLKNYVDNYFDNLDVQDEINNKLNEMVEDGTLPEIIASYLNSKAVFGFDNVESMKNATNLIDGSYAQTLGFYSKNDGGNAVYKIRTITNDDVVDECTIISLYNKLLIAELVNPSNVNQFGAYGDNIHNDTQAIQKAINYFSQKSKKELRLLKGTYLISTLSIHNNINIKGYGSLSILKSINNNDNDLLTIKDEGFNFIKLENFKIDGNKNNSNSKTGILIDKSLVDPRLQKDSYVTMRDLIIININGDGIKNGTGGRGNIIDNCYIRECNGHGINFRASDSIIINTNCCFNKFTGIWVSGSAHRVVNSKCYCNGFNNDSENRPDLCGILITGINTQVDSCDCQENYGDGIVLANDSNQLINVKVDRNGQRVITYDDNNNPIFPGDDGLIYAGIRVDRYYKNAPVRYCTIIASATDYGRPTNIQLQKTGIEINDLQNSNIILSSKNQVVDIDYGHGWPINLTKNNSGALNNVILNGQYLGNEFKNRVTLKNITLNDGTKYEGALILSNENNELASQYRTWVEDNNRYHLSLYDKDGKWKSNLINASITNGEGAIGFFNRLPQTQKTAPAIPTDLQSCIGAIVKLIQILEEFGFIKSS